jgi:hypothetical protein
MDNFIKREQFLYDYGMDVELIKTKNIHSLAFRLFSHVFVDDKEKDFFLGDSGIETDRVSYMFKSDPPVPFSLMSEKVPLSAGDGAVYMYVIYYNKHTSKPGIVCASIENGLEFGSKHVSLVNYINKTMSRDIDDLVFVTAGELLHHWGWWEFNFFSGTFSVPRLAAFDSIKDSFEDFDLSEHEYLAMKSTMTDWTIVKRLLSNLHPSESFEFSSSGFEIKKKRSLMGILEFVGPSKNYPYVVPGNEANHNAFKKAVAIVGTFVNLREMSVVTVRTTSWATEAVVTTSVGYSDRTISVNDVDENAGPRPQMVGGMFVGNVRVLPYKSDLKRALVVLREINAKKLEYGRNLRLEPLKSYVDIFKLSGKKYNLSVKYPTDVAKLFRGTLTVGKFLSSSNDEVYMGELDEKLVVVKVTSLYPFNENKRIPYPTTEERFYGSDIYSFVIPGIGAVATIYPYLGRTVYDIPLNERVSLFVTFKSWILDKYVSMLTEHFSGAVFTKYNDYKPENITLDKDGNFHLIDYDEWAYTPRFYGPTPDRSFVNQMFGVLLILQWFKTDDIPFNAGTPGGDKIKWAMGMFVDSELRGLFDILLDDGISVTEKIELFKTMTYR